MKMVHSTPDQGTPNMGNKEDIKAVISRKLVMFFYTGDAVCKEVADLTLWRAAVAKRAHYKPIKVPVVASGEEAGVKAKFRVLTGPEAVDHVIQASATRAYEAVACLYKLWSVLSQLSELDLGLLEDKTVETFRYRFALYSAAGWADKWLKYHFTCYCNHLIQTEFQEFPDRPPFLPPHEVGGMFLSGKGYKQLRLLYQLPILRRRVIGWSISQGKAIWPRPDDAQVHESIAKTFRTLTKVQPSKIPALYWQACRLIVEQIYSPGSRYRESYGALRRRRHLPNGSSNFKGGRKDGGNYVSMLEHVDTNHRRIERYSPYEPENAWVKEPCAPVPYFRCNDYLPHDGEFCRQYEIDGFDAKMCEKCETWSVNSWTEMCTPERGTVEEAYMRFMENVKQRAGSEAMDANLVGLKEAFKVRAITQGPPARYHLAQNLRFDIHGILRRHPNFSLIGGGNLEEALRYGLSFERFTKVFGDKYGDLYLSGDYEAATDNLNPEVSKYIAQLLSAQLGYTAAEQRLLVDCLVNHEMQADFPATKWLDYEDSTVQKGRSIRLRRARQLWGQLMGSPVSFPILCLANAATVLTAVWMFQDSQGMRRTLRLSDIPFLVNGDDLAARLPFLVIKHWEAVSQAVGLKKSIGKNYVARDWVVINSEMFHTHARNVEGELVRSDSPVLTGVHSFPWRVVFAAESRSAVGVDWDPVDGRTELWEGFMDLTQCCQYAYQETPSRIHEWVHSQLVRSRFDILSNRYPRGGWDLPRWAGGPGLIGPDYRGVESLSISDQYVCASVLDRARNEELSLVELTRCEVPKTEADHYAAAFLYNGDTVEQIVKPRGQGFLGYVDAQSVLQEESRWWAFLAGALPRVDEQWVFHGDRDYHDPIPAGNRPAPNGAWFRQYYADQLENASLRGLAPLSRIEGGIWNQGLDIYRGTMLVESKDLTNPQIEVLQRSGHQYCDLSPYF